MWGKCIFRAFLKAQLKDMNILYLRTPLFSGGMRTVINESLSRCIMQEISLKVIPWYCRFLLSRRIDVIYEMLQFEEKDEEDRKEGDYNDITWAGLERHVLEKVITFICFSIYYQVLSWLILISVLIFLLIRKTLRFIRKTPLLTCKWLINFYFFLYKINKNLSSLTYYHLASKYLNKIFITMSKMFFYNEKQWWHWTFS